ncbi:MAG: ectoine/hydroxyectoine ABC transporter permease subunit EhuC [Desulfobulbaceae bacterium]|nr:ectoine/hydroxyectoine ABC transporter permease subunit EhuC [Desulfobulbaceae bacterium]
MPRCSTRLVVVLIIGVTAGLLIATFSGIRDLLPELFRGVRVTIQVTGAGIVVAVIAALSAAIMKMYGPFPLRWLAIAYIEVFRGTSALVQLFWLFFVLPQFGLVLSPFAAAVLALGLNSGAYGAEVVRGAINAVDQGQWEAGRALNLSRMQTLRRVILPQAFINMIPPWGNLLIELLKATALVSMISLSDLAFKAQQLNQNTLRTVEIFSVVLLFYLAISLLITAAMRSFETYAAKGLSRGRMG